MVHDFTTANRSRNVGPWYLTIDPQHRLIRGKAYSIVKRAIDLTLCLLVAPLLVPLFGLLALLVYIDAPGKIFFCQLRTGKGGRRFRMYKFRTMVANAEELKSKYAHLNELTWPDFKITDDPRVTRVGRILRKTSLDELPQLLNVIKGDMSLVGPRPTSFAPETYRLWHTERLEVVPGITGLWQVSGRSNLDFDQRLKLDIAYIERQSIWMDIQIIVRTVAEVFIGEGAY
jgi:lipopolysaccharide/colanic/teichoic acid biosynthesis glycosyltransferase